MNSASLNQQLQATYEPYLAQLYEQDWPADLSAPLLMRVFEEYAWVPTKILFVGQETHGWGHLNQRPTVSRLQQMYASFDLGKRADYGDGRKPRYLRSPFWNFCRSCFQQLNSDAGITRKVNGFLWTNISKFDSSGTTPHPDLQRQNRLGFDLLKQEIAIIQPDVVVFMTGTKYDDWLDLLFKPDREPILAGGLLDRLRESTLVLPALTFQTKHPRTLCMQKTYHLVLSELVKSVNSN